MMTYTRKNTPIINDYNIDGQILKRCTTFKDLGITFDSKLTFNAHIEILCLQCYKLLGFLFRNTRDFDNRVLVRFFNAF
ncbi:hypothetical protein, partial [Enterobacter cloacae complex sp. 2DZ2F20B]|uniref:hypothetical protein n=1 Tax=Enterobacter cloacae complex sp. 2DZ2F20B TaxID=2511993 RepID=UPI001CA52C6E